MCAHKVQCAELRGCCGCCRRRAWAGQGGGVILTQVTDASRLDPEAPPEDDDRTLRRPCRAADMMSYAPLDVADAEVSPARPVQASERIYFTFLGNAKYICPYLDKTNAR